MIYLAVSPLAYALCATINKSNGQMPHLYRPETVLKGIPIQTRISEGNEHLLENVVADLALILFEISSIDHLQYSISTMELLIWKFSKRCLIVS